MSLELKALMAAIAAALSAVGGALGLAAIVRSSPPPPIPSSAETASTSTNTGTPTTTPSVTTATVPPAPTAEQPAPGNAAPAGTTLPTAQTPRTGQVPPVSQVPPAGQAPSTVPSNPANGKQPAPTPRFTRRLLNRGPAPGIAPALTLQPGTGQPGVVTGQQTTPPQIQVQPTPQPAALTPAAQAAMGKALYAPACASCHGADGEGSLGPSLHHLARSDMQIITVIKNGKGVMPAYRTKYTDAQIQALLFFIRSLK